MTISNPFQDFWVPNGWSSWHQAIDYATPQGTVFTSPADGVYRHRPSELRTDIPGQAGHYGDIVLADGRRIRVCHLERHIAADGAQVKRGVTPIGATGNTGTSSGPHMHTTGFHADGTRWNWTLEAVATPADTEAEPFPSPFVPKVSPAMAEMYLREDDDCPNPGRVWRLAPGSGFSFTSPGQYQANRNQIAAYRAAGATDLVVPPADPSKVPTVTRATLNHFRVNYFGLGRI